MKKIKNVTLAKDFRNLYYEIPKGTKLFTSNNQFYWDSEDHECFNIHEITDNKTGLFDITYESEYYEPPREEFVESYYNTIDKRRDKYLDCIIYCNLLKKKCDEINKEYWDCVNTYIFYFDIRNECFLNVSYSDLASGGLKFNSRPSANQFLRQCKPEMLELLKELYSEKDLI